MGKRNSYQRAKKNFSLNKHCSLNKYILIECWKMGLMSSTEKKDVKIGLCGFGED